MTQWKAPGAVWVRLTGNASVLHGVEGLRAREAIVRIVDVAIGGENVRQVEFYAEGAGPAFRGQPVDAAVVPRSISHK